MKTTHSSYNTINSVHADVIRLLPWYVNNSVAEHEKKLIDRHIQSCVTCRIELQHQQQFSEIVRQSNTCELIPKESFAHLKARIQHQSASRPVAQVARTARKPLYTHWLASFRNAWGWPQSAYLMAGLCLMLFPMQLLHNSQWPVSINPFRTLSTSPEHNLSSHDIRVVFADTVDSEQIRQIVSSVQGRVMEGPSTHAVFRIRIAEAASERPLALEAVIQLLRKRKEVVFVEPVYAALSSVQRK